MSSSSSSMTMTTNYIPLDIWREILVRVPAETLIRGRAVCKGWRAVINDPCFVRAHTNKTSNIIIIQENIPIDPDVGSCYSLDLETLITSFSSSNGHQAVADLDLKLSFPVVACHGLILTEKPAFTIWNPLTRERLKLPRGKFSKNKSSAFGLGYDGTTDDYKAVVILRNCETHVYSLKLDTWRRIMNCPTCDWRGRVEPGVFVSGGSLNWLSAYDDKIVSLDLGTEKYSLLPLPSVRNNKSETKFMLLNVFGGCLALSDSGLWTHLDVWVMKQLGSWNKLLSIDKKPKIYEWGFFLRPIAFIMEEEKLLVFLQDSMYGFYIFDVETKSLKSVEIDIGSIIRNHDGSNSDANQMFVGTIFRLHANCGGGVRKIAPSTKKKKKKKKKKASSFADVE